MSNAKAGETSNRNRYISCDDAWYNFNHKFSRDGHLFRERFKSEPVNDMAYFVTLLRYIHQNPVKAGMVAEVKGKRASLRQLERLTGISKSMIYRMG